MLIVFILTDRGVRYLTWASALQQSISAMLSVKTANADDIGRIADSTLSGS
jgi:hypothetical protein